MSKPQEIFLKDYLPPSHEVLSLFLDFDILQGHTLVTSRMEMQKNPESSVEELRLYGQDLELSWLKVDGEAFGGFAQDEEGLLLRGLPKTFLLEIQVKIIPEENKALEGLYHSGKMYCTQCEPHGFRRMTFYPDRPDVMSLFTTRITADKASCPVLLSNGNKIEEGELDDGRHFAVWKDPHKKPAYLFALVAGDLKVAADSYTTMSGKEVALELWVEEKDLDRTEHGLTSLKQAMKWDEDTYGLEYDLDIYMIVAVDDFNMGAMENKGLNIFNSSAVLANPATATDADFAQIQGIIAHEYFHNWTGNRVTCRDWFQLSLKEGLTIYRDQTFSQDLNSAAVFRIEDVKLLRAFQFPEDAGPMAHPVRPESFIEINNFYTMTVYNKGSELIRMMWQYLGQEKFRKGMDLYFQRHDGQAVTTEDFAKAMEDAGEIEFGNLLRWYSQAGTPVVEVERYWDDQAKEYTLTFTQSCPATPGQPTKLPFRMPIRSGLLAGDGSPLPLTFQGESETGPEERILDFTNESQSFIFVGLDEEPVPSLFRGFSAPVRLKMEQSNEELAFLIAKDPDEFNRWEASQRLMINGALLLVEQVEQGRELSLPEGFLSAFGQVLEDRKLDPALAAHMLRLPTEPYLGEQMPLVKVEPIHQVLVFLRESMRKAFEGLWQARYQELCDEGDYEFNSEQAGKRSLKNLCLFYLTASGSTQQARGQYEAAKNMTDSMAALASLMEVPGEDREQALESFYQTWKQDSLVLNNWFALQAGSATTNVAKIKELMEHPAFDFNNPNKLRSLVGVFCMRNQLGFHQADGEGYRFLGDLLLRLDKLNPQMSARLFTPFTRIKRYDAGRRQLMTREVERLLAEDGLSKNLFELAHKTKSDLG